MRTVYILGAGFSHAIDPIMPLMSGLSQLVADRLDLSTFGSAVDGAAVSDDFEVWLTYLAADQPWLTPSENMRNHAAFFDVARTVANVMTEAQGCVVTKPVPPWLSKLLVHWREHSSTVITFNYDELVELALEAVLRDVGPTGVYPIPLAPIISRVSVGGFFGASSEGEAFKLLKLHGSLNWFYSGADSPSNDTIYRGSTGASWRSAGYVPKEDSRTIDKEPLIVPPTTSKNAFYANNTLKSAWRIAGSAISEADELHLIGYSAPKTDLLIRSMIATKFKGQRVVLVNPDPYSAKSFRQYLPMGSRSEVLRLDTLQEYVEDLPEVRISCANEKSHVATFDLLDLSESADQAVDAGICPLCEQEIRSNPAGMAGYTCRCCNCWWRGKSAPFYFVPGIRTSLRRNK